MLHIGAASFHRAHQAVCTHRLRETGDCVWTSVGGNSRPDMPNCDKLRHDGDPAPASRTDSLPWEQIAGEPRLKAARPATERVFRFAREPS